MRRLVIHTPHRFVSIPGRDLGVLEHPGESRLALFWLCFNPWKGFGGFGTGIVRGSLIVSFCFNPWKGFGGFGTTDVYFHDDEDGVSIPGRDLGVLELRSRRVPLTERRSFNPWKGFGGFGTRSGCGGRVNSCGFQSLEGIWGFWNSRSPLKVLDSYLFQSLEGIWGFWNNRIIEGMPEDNLFQSLEGIWGFWNVYSYLYDLLRNCFNPWKGFGGFGTMRILGLEPLVKPRFNPWKGFGGFGTHLPIAANIKRPNRFNPWKGFWGFGTNHWEGVEGGREVSIPGRDLGVLELAVMGLEASFFEVSIPGRDLGVLELVFLEIVAENVWFQSLEGIWGFWNLGCLPVSLARLGFNPWKGFGGFGTTPTTLTSVMDCLFQSLEGIWGFWNLGINAPGSIERTGFNPWKGFGGFGTMLRRGAVSWILVSIPGRDLGVLERK